MNLVRISPDNTALLKNFLEHAGSALKAFRYFNKRSFDVLKNHIVTFILEEDENALAYGHLDREGETVWLGICVIESQQGRGFGNKMMEELLKFADENQIPTIKLAVDNDNLPAQSLYKKFGFVKTAEHETHCFFERTT
ncbi:GNAT family N-acetyltransferase [bacterium]|nr:GNAT family N-acetyltransferase [bacterium]